MYGLMKVYDHNIIAINQSDSTIVVRDGKDVHTIELKICADNFKKEHGDSNGMCVGDRNAEGKYFCLNTSGIKTMIYFILYNFFLFSSKSLVHKSAIQPGS